LAIFTDSKNFSNTLMVTLIFGNDFGIKKIFSFLQNLSHKMNNKKIQILTQLENLPKCDGLEKRFSFNLMSKDL